MFFVFFFCSVDEAEKMEKEHTEVHQLTKNTVSGISRDIVRLSENLTNPDSDDASGRSLNNLLWKAFEHIPQHKRKCYKYVGIQEHIDDYDGLKHSFKVLWKPKNTGGEHGDECRKMNVEQQNMYRSGTKVVVDKNHIFCKNHYRNFLVNFQTGLIDAVVPRWLQSSYSQKRRKMCRYKGNQHLQVEGVLVNNCEKSNNKTDYQNAKRRLKEGKYETKECKVKFRLPNCNDYLNQTGLLGTTLDDCWFEDKVNWEDMTFVLSIFQFKIYVFKIVLYLSFSYFLVVNSAGTCRK